MLRLVAQLLLPGKALGGFSAWLTYTDSGEGWGQGQLGLSQW